MSLLTGLVVPEAPSLEARLAAKRWQRRVILVYALDNKNSDLLAQRRLLDEQRDGLNERDFDQIVVVDSEMAAADRSYLRTIDRKLTGDTRFTTYLIGKDGGVKQRFLKPVTAQELFRIVDSMPMRQSEMRRKN